MTASRLAVYWAPPVDHPLWAAGAAWLGRDAADPRDDRPPRGAALSEPWRYGFHATLKAPMRLRPGRTPDDVAADGLAVAARHAPFEMPPLVVAALNGFLALRPASPLTGTHPLRRLADDVVHTLDVHRAPPTQSELARRRHPGLTARQQDHLRAWGYPYVLEDWRFHISLTGTLAVDDPQRHGLWTAAQAHFACALAQPLRCVDLAIFMQPAADRPFVLQRRMPLGPR